MKRIPAIFIFVFFTSFLSHVQKKKIVFFGDSITEGGIGPKGYITIIQEKLTRQGLAAEYELSGAGIGGNKIYDLYLRMEEDVLKKNPDIVVIWVGVNDVWHKISFGTGTDADKFEKFYTAIIKKFRSDDIKVFLCTPAVIGERTDHSNQLDGDLNRYSRIIRNLADSNQCQLIDLRKAFLEYNLTNNKENAEQGILTTDRVHLNDKGNEFVADYMLKALMK